MLDVVYLALTLSYLLEQVPTSASSSVQRRVPSSGTSTSSSAKVKDRRTLAASSELDKNQGAWARKAGLLRLVLLTKTFLLFSVTF